MVEQEVLKEMDLGSDYKKQVKQFYKMDHPTIKLMWAIKKMLELRLDIIDFYTSY